MRAFVRNEEMYIESQWTPFTQNHIEWTHTKSPDGDNYALAENCPSDAVASDFDITQTEHTEGEGEEARTVVLLTATLNQNRYDARKASENTE